LGHVEKPISSFVIISLSKSAEQARGDLFRN
jgi:hypothetical protein